MTSIHKTALLPYPAEQLYALALKVEDYPLFLPWCKAVILHEQTELFQDATLKLSKSFWTDQFRTHNTLNPGQSIRMRLVEGPFNKLEGAWLFHAVGNSGTQVALQLEFEVKLGPLQSLVSSSFKQMAETILQAFCQRAEQVLGSQL